MNTWQQFVKDYLTFSKKDRIAVYTLIGIVIILAVAPFFIKEKELDELTEEDIAFVEELKSQFSNKNESSNDVYVDRYEDNKDVNDSRSVNYFYFDPNTITTDDWLRLGVSPKAATTIKNYISKGGTFRKPEDLLKIYNLNKNLARTLMPYVRIGGRYSDNPSVTSTEDIPEKSSDLKSSFPKKEYHPIVINTADTTEWMSLPGIGSFRAKKIVELRDSILGFRDVEQLSGRWFLPDSVYQKLVPYFSIGDYQYPTLNINTITQEKLRKHPLFGSNRAEAIIAYRNQHGAFTELSDLLKIHIVDEAFYNKIKSFVVVR